MHQAATELQLTLWHRKTHGGAQFLLKCGFIVFTFAQKKKDIRKDVLLLVLGPFAQSAPDGENGHWGGCGGGEEGEAYSCPMVRR